MPLGQATMLATSNRNPVQDGSIAVGFPVGPADHKNGVITIGMQGDIGHGPETMKIARSKRAFRGIGA